MCIYYSVHAAGRTRNVSTRAPIHIFIKTAALARSGVITTGLKKKKKTAREGNLPRPGRSPRMEHDTAVEAEI